MALFGTYGLLTLSILALWLRHVPGSGKAARAARQLWLALLAAAVVTGLLGGFVEPVGVLWIAAFGLAAYAFGREGASRRQRALSAIAIVVLSAGLATHLLPGFHNPRVISNVGLTPDALPFRLHLNFDKTIIGLFLLAFCHPLIARVAEWKTMVRRAAPVALGTIVVLMVAALLSGYVHWAPKFPPEARFWLWANLCFTCVAEEALFRGFVQAGLQRAWQHSPQGAWWALLVAAMLFGLAHAGGGPAYIALSTVAGIGYGWVYLRTGRIEASILTHFSLNAVHFLGFTYPALAVAA